MKKIILKSASLDSLDLRPGDTLVALSVQEDTITVSLIRDELTDREKSMEAFLDKWSGAFSLPEPPYDDDRLAYLIAKHVK